MEGKSATVSQPQVNKNTQVNLINNQATLSSE